MQSGELRALHSAAVAEREWCTDLQKASQRGWQPGLLRMALPARCAEVMTLVEGIMNQGTEPSVVCHRNGGWFEIPAEWLHRMKAGP